MDIQEILRILSEEVNKAAQDLGIVVKETEKFVDEMAPKVQSTVGDTIVKTSEALKQALVSIDQQTRPQQAMLLEGYRTFLQRQLDGVEKRLEDLKSSGGRRR